MGALRELALARPLASAFRRGNRFFLKQAWQDLTGFLALQAGCPAASWIPDPVCLLLAWWYRRVLAQWWSLYGTLGNNDAWVRDPRARARPIVFQEVRAETFVASLDAVLQGRELVVDSDGVLFDHALLVEGLDHQLLETLVVLLVDLGHFHWNRNLLFLEVVDQVRHQRALLLLLVQHRRHEVDELARVLRDRLRGLVHDRVEELGDGALVERGLETGHGVQSHSHCPDVAPHVVALLLDDFRRQTEGRADDLLGLDVAVVVKQARLGHVSELDCLVVVAEKQVHALHIAVDHSPRVQVEQPHADLPSEAP